MKLLGERLQVRRARFRPLLPLGRVAHLDEPIMCEGLMQHLSPEDMLKSECRPLTSCGIGQNLFVKPDGRAYPCYAWCAEHTCVGDVFADGLESVLTSSGYARLMRCSVDSIAKCRDCEFRYLCGGACRAWGNQTMLDVNAPPPHCEHLKTRAEKLIDAAREYVLGQRWLTAAIQKTARRGNGYKKAAHVHKLSGKAECSKRKESAGTPVARARTSLGISTLSILPGFMLLLAGILRDVFMLLAGRRMLFAHCRLLELQDKQDLAHFQSPFVVKGLSAPGNQRSA